MKLSVILKIVLLLGLLTACSSNQAASQPTSPAEPSPAATTVTAATATQLPAPTATPIPATAAPTPVPPTNTPPAEPDATESAGNPDLDFAQVQFLQATETGDGVWRFDVTVRHNDQGWDHYADLWQVEDLQGNVLGERVLAHPHDTEQPFTRSQSGIAIPATISQVVVRAKCNVHGFGGQEIIVDLTTSEADNYEVQRSG